jgi:hypothetical protein
MAITNDTQRGSGKSSSQQSAYEHTGSTVILNGVA